MKNAIVTGAGRGIGLAVAEEFAAAGVKVWANTRTRSDAFESRLREINNQTGIDVRPLYFDVSDPMAAKKAVMEVYKADGKIDILVNNAGMSMEALFLMTSQEKMKELFDVNFFGPFYISQIVARLMMKAHSGSIVNIASVTGTQNYVGGAAYGSSKAALLYASKTMAKELGPYGIRVNCVLPGFINTRMWQERTDGLKEQIAAETPLRRQGTPQEVAKAVVFLAGDDAGFITGGSLEISGGGR